MIIEAFILGSAIMLAASTIVEGIKKYKIKLHISSDPVEFKSNFNTTVTYGNKDKE